MFLYNIPNTKILKHYFSFSNNQFMNFYQNVISELKQNNSK